MHEHAFWVPNTYILNLGVSQTVNNRLRTDRGCTHMYIYTSAYFSVRFGQSKEAWVRTQRIIQQNARSGAAATWIQQMATGWQSVILCASEKILRPLVTMARSWELSLETLQP